MQMNEMAILHSIAGTCCRECPCMNLDATEDTAKTPYLKACHLLHIKHTGKEDYITPRNRSERPPQGFPSAPRREGRAAAEQSMKKYDEIWDEILERFGEDNMKNLIELIQSLG